MKLLTYRVMSILLVTAACSKPDMTVVPPPGTTEVNTLTDYLNNQFSLSLFAAAVDLAGLSEDLANTTYTLFAVDNEGFNRIGISSPADLQRWSVDSLRNFVQNHLLPGRLNFEDIPRSLDTRYETISKQELLVSYHKTNAAPILTANGVNLLPNPKASDDPYTFGTSLLNGMVYPIATPIKTTVGNVQDFLASRPDFSIFVAGLRKFGQWDRLATQPQITVLAPPDSVFLRHGIDRAYIEQLDELAYKTLFMDAYIIDFNRVFTNDVQTQVNETSFPFNNLASMLILRTSDPETHLALINRYREFIGIFLFLPNISQPTDDSPWDPFWTTPILGSNKDSYPSWDNPNGGFIIPYTGEKKVLGGFESLTGRFVNHNCANGVVHFVNGLLIMPDEAKR